MPKQTATALSLVDTSFPPAPKLPRTTTSLPPSRSHDTGAIDEGWAIERHSYIQERSPRADYPEPKDGLESLDTRSPKTAPKIAPACDTFRGNEATFLHIDAPGILAEEMSLTLIDDALVFQATRKSWAGGSPSEFHREFTVTRDMDRDRIDATLKHGLLVVRIPDAPRRSTRIEVRTSGAPDESIVDELIESEELHLPLPEYDVEF